MVDDDRTAGLVLAAGAGSRYGRPKILVEGWLAGAVTALREGGCDTVTVVTGAARPQLPAGAVEAHCPTWQRGPGASLRAGLSAVEGARVVIHLVDCPDVGPEVVRRLIGRSADHLGRAVFDGRPGHPVLVPRAHLAPLLAGLHEEEGAGPYLRAQPHTTVECGDLATGRDVDVADSGPHPAQEMEGSAP